MPKKNTGFEIEIDEQKLKLIAFYAANKGDEIDLEAKLTDAANKELEKYYIKYVPKDVRFMMENKEIIESGRKPEKKSVQNAVSDQTEKGENENGNYNNNNRI